MPQQLINCELINSGPTRERPYAGPGRDARVHDGSGN